MAIDFALDSYREGLKKQFAAITFATVSFIVALAWNSFFNHWISHKEKGTSFLFLYALVATLVGVVLVTVAYSLTD